ncbi:uncharacterized protein V1510DRAFT_404301 [Dipodascopsis tothii]|uniref:uncharacterized protein n=1 Tax=Dipodascopsis tothii TaxID=44089 RepID=UPI0034CFF660
MDLGEIISTLQERAETAFDADLFIAVLAAQVCRQHVLVTVDEAEQVAETERALAQIGAAVFGLQPLAVQCSATMTTAELTAALTTAPDGPATLAVLRDVGTASDYVQAQLLDILRTRAGPVLAVPVVVRTRLRPQLFAYLVDHMFISHHYDAKDAPAAPTAPPKTVALFPRRDVDRLGALLASIHISTEVRRYMQDIMVFLRMHRVVRGGVSSRATRDFELAVRCLSLLNGLAFATPSVVAVAARKVYAHRVVVVTDPSDDRSVLWGSDLDAVRAFLDQWDTELVLDDVLASVPAPL